jgi:hypothetical protein
LAESKLGDHQLAIERLQTVIDEQLALGVSGLQLGASYEARTRIAIWAGDRAAIDRYAHLTAEEYRHGVGSALAGRYQRLLDDAQLAGAETLPALSDFQSTALLTGPRGRRTSAQAQVAREMRSAATARERAACAVRLLCESQGAKAGHLYLCHDRGIRLAASHGIADLPEGLEAFMSEYFTRETKSDDTATELATDSASELSCAPTRSGFTDARGAFVRPILISCLVDGTARYAGVAALITDNPEVVAGGAQLASAIGAHLIRIGDVRQASR